MNKEKKILTHLIDKIYTLGPQASFHHLSVESFLREQAAIATVSLESDFDLLFSKAEEGAFIWVAVENNLAGEVFNHKHKIQNLSLEILAEFKFDVEFVAAASHDLDKVERIFTHPKAYEECEDIINEYWPDAEYIPTTSTAEAAKGISKEKFNDLVICHKKAAEFYELQIIRENLLGNKENFTVFNLLKIQK